MMMILRSMGYEDILKVVKGKRTAVWTCNTCARMCGPGGQDAAARLTAKLTDDGVNVSSCVSVSAACLMSKVISKMQETTNDVDIVVALTCDIGVTCISKIFKKDVLAPLITVGYGYMDENGVPIVTSYNGTETSSPLSKIAEEKGMNTDSAV